MGKRIGFAFLTLGLVAFFFFSFVIGFEVATRVPASVSRAQVIRGEAKTRDAIKAVYNMSCDLPDEPRRLMQLYLPRYIAIGAEGAAFYAQMFNIEGEPTETDEFYRFTQGGEILDVYRYVSLIKYRNAAHETGLGELDTEGAADAAAAFIANRMLPLEYEESLVTFDGADYNVTFIGSLGGKPNYAFPVTAEVGADGVVRSLEYYYFSYEPIAQHNIMPSTTAFLELPTDFADGRRIDISEARLVYFFADSIIQPAYVFSGVIEGTDEGFEVFIKAADYN